MTGPRTFGISLATAAVVTLATAGIASAERPRERVRAHRAPPVIYVDGAHVPYDHGWQQHAPYQHAPYGHDRGYDAARAAAEIERRLQRQAWRIERASRIGELSWHEARRLDRKHRRMARRFARFCRDHYLSPHEFNAMARALDRVSEDIYRAAHDRDRRQRRPARPTYPAPYGPPTHY